MQSTSKSPQRKKTGQSKGSKSGRRVEVMKTYKIYIGGKFSRSESGHYYTPGNRNGNVLASICLCSRKDFRDAVVAARSAFGNWSERPAMNRGQILYRIAEMLEGRKAQFTEELMRQDVSWGRAQQEVNLSVDRLVHYAGWCDKYQQLFSTVNPVASSHLNFSVPEPTGVVAIIAPERSALLGLVSVIVPVIAGGNTCVALASESMPLCAVSFAEVIHASDVPGGVVNILTGREKDLYGHFSLHMDVNAMVYARDNGKVAAVIGKNAAGNIKRVVMCGEKDWFSEEGQSPYYIMDYQEIKTTWHPIENTGGNNAGY